MECYISLLKMFNSFMRNINALGIGFPVPRIVIGLFQKLDTHPLKKTWESPKNFNHALNWEIKKNKRFFGCKGKEDMGIPKIFNHF